MDSRTLNIKMPAELYEKLQKEAEKKCISLAALVRMICAEYFDK